MATFTKLHLNSDGAYTLAASATGSLPTLLSNSFNVYDLVVTSLTPTATGFTATFSEAFSPATLNLYNSSSLNGGPGAIWISAASSRASYSCAASSL